jgi:threonine dehydrogenase-like Zn-dependent dehydrogenase
MFPHVYKSAKVANGTVTIENLEFPKDLHNNTLVIKPYFMGICRSDIKEVIGSRDIPEDRGPLFGHEFIGEIVYSGNDTA